MSDIQKSKWQEYKEKNGVTPLDALNPNTEYASEEKSNQRFDICKACPRLIKLTTQCKECMCIMKIKTKFEAAKCPLEKW
jgi:hypothetical protein